MKLHLTGDLAHVEKAVDILAEELSIQRSGQGYPIQLTQREGPLYVAIKDGHGEIRYQENIHFMRALGLWIEQYQNGEDFELIEEPQFEMTGAMLDSSRNAVLTVAGIQDMLRKMAIMGLNTLMVYTEDTYEVEEYPYFGYMRGRYSEQELKICDDYATELGIEMIPCIQTLAHLTEALKWNYAIQIRDTADILLAGHAETYQFLEKVITAATKPFKSKRIHIGMDEAHQLGLGKYLDRNGYEERFMIMNQHLKEVVAITNELGLDPMIWSDMYFRLGSENGDYYDPEAKIPEDIKASIPDTQLVYWDYYHIDEDFYRTFIQKHQDLKSDTVFAGGVWTWNGISPNYGKAIATTEAALAACKQEGVKEVFATMWGDNGAETPVTTALPILQLFAEHSYRKDITDQHLAERFQFCTGSDYDSFMLLNQFDETPGVSKDNLHASNPSKFLLWQDILIGLYDENIRGWELGEHYTQLAFQLEKAKEKNGGQSLLFDFYGQLAKVLAAKAEMGLHIKQAYDEQDSEKMKGIVKQVAALSVSANSLREKHRTLWFSMNKPFGWEVLEIRYGGLITRMDTVQYRQNQWLNGEVDRIEELEEERLYFEGPYPMPEGALGRNLYHRIVTASILS